MSAPHVVVVGAGVGGLALAARMAHRGVRVTVLEKTEQVGGRNRTLHVGAVRFDSGPSLLMMRGPFQQLFSDLGETFEEHFDLRLCDPNYRVFFGDGTRFDATSHHAKMVRQLEIFSGRDDAQAFAVMMGELADLYRASIDPFVRRNYDSPLDLVTPGGARTALKHGMLGNLSSGMKKRFKDPRLHSLFCLQTMYLGLSPFQAPWVYATLVYMEYGEGIWYPMGGMTLLATEIARLATDRGAEIRLNTAVTGIEGGRVTLADGSVIEADAVVCNADLPYAERELLPKPVDPKIDKRRYSCSAHMLYMDYEGELPEMEHHNIILGKDFEGNLKQIFDEKKIPDDPALYVQISAKTDPSKAAPGHLDVFLLIPCPNLDHPFTEADAADLKEKAFTRLESETSFRRENVRALHVRDPHEWKELLNLDKGATFGLSHDLLQSVAFRPSNRSKKDKKLFFVGASTTPGNGLPMVLISAELAEKRLVESGLLRDA